MGVSGPSLLLVVYRLYDLVFGIYIFSPLFMKVPHQSDQVIESQTATEIPKIPSKSSVKSKSSKTSLKSVSGAPEVCKTIVPIMVGRIITKSYTI